MKLRAFNCVVCEEPTKAKPGTLRNNYSMCPDHFRERRHDERVEEGRLISWGDLPDPVYSEDSDE